MEHTGFPSDETLAAFLDGRLDPDTRRRVVEHMTTCDECYSVVMGAGGGIPFAIPTSVAAPTRGSAARRNWLPHTFAAAAIILLVSVLLTSKQNLFLKAPRTGALRT